MLIRILLALIVIILIITARYLFKNFQPFGKMLASENTEMIAEIQETLQAFGKVCLALSVLGLAVFAINHQTISLVYICIVMLASAIFSIKLSKKIS
ncbi:hypothetical protein [Vagococcus intermedius]|uniref:DUF3784 domain-containing protein n=1 Tax=Vagococcus intermedius TaxID=2991418 RepID=A0AAF0CUQ9_9ENTE|nr:hypothetical protein [Vagococcus intermedius]WEG73219.1 hypothetical protein OL234_09685 [Vagococcus intermedius]WEG75304.1 hypothetical protein OL235_09680 [Vagococcus intermedius]